MKKSIAMRWAKALESGRYKQTIESLQDSNGNCCLGVLCRISRKGKFINNDAFLEFGLNGDSQSNVLIPGVMRWAGISTEIGEFAGTSLADLNDTGKSFKEIAKIIRKHYKEL